VFGLEFSSLLDYVDITSPELIAQAKLLRKNTPSATAKFTFEFVKQKFTYVSEKKDHWQKPLVTLQKKTGDCEDLSTLLASLLTINAVPNWLLVVRNHQWEQYHVINAVNPLRVAYEPLLLLDPSIEQTFGSKPYYYDHVFIWGFYGVNTDRPSLPLIIPLPLNLFMSIYSYIINPYLIPIGSNKCV